MSLVALFCVIMFSVLFVVFVDSDFGMFWFIWYDDVDGFMWGECIELLVWVIVNWMVKVVNLFVDELDVDVGDVVVFDLFVYW